MSYDKLENRFMKIFNENTTIVNQYTVDEIHNAFKRASYNSDITRVKQIYNIFFKNFTPKDENEFLKKFKIQKSSLRKVYLSSPYKKIESIAKPWDDKLRIKIINRSYKELELIKQSQKKQQLINRNNDKYIDIDKFEIYELTPCIAYEMAIRNEEVKSILKRYEKIKSMKIDPQYMYKRGFSKSNFNNAKKHPIQHFLKEYENYTFEEYEYAVMCKKITYGKLIEDNYKKFIDDYIDKCTELSLLELDILEEKLENELINEFYIYPKGYRRKIPNASPIISEEINNTQTKLETVEYEKEKDEIIYERIVHDEFIETRGLYVDSNEYFINNIIPNFKRQINDQYQMTIPINLSLPLEEINEYIKIIQKKAKITSPLELLEEELEQANNLTYMNTINSKGDNIHFDGMKGEKPQYNLSNMLYIYDMIKDGFAVNDIQNSILNYYAYLQKEKKTDLNFNLSDLRTVELYCSIAKDYIEEKRYKELIIGKTKKTSKSI